MRGRGLRSTSLATSLATCLALATLLAAGPAAANGRYPATSTVHFQPGSTRDIFIGATWGLIFTRDGGATWRWVCELAIGYGGEYDPDYAVTSSGTVLATTFDGLSTTRDGCAFAGTSLGKLLVSTVTVGPDDVVWAATSDATDSRVYRSNDQGKTFTAVASAGLDKGAWWESLEVAPSSAKKIYLSGYRVENGMAPLLRRSDDAGVSWKPMSTAGLQTSDKSVLQIAGISPDDPNLVFLRVTNRTGALGDGIYRSTNGGDAWTLVKALDDSAPGLVVRKLPAPGDASKTAEVILGTRASGTFRSTDGGVTFTALARSLQVGCMAERPEDRTLFACANNGPPDDMALASSTNAVDWTAALLFRNVTSPVQCDPGAVQRDECQDKLWCGFKSQLGITSTVLACAGGDGGVVTPPKEDGCCDAGREAGGTAGAAALVVIAVLGRRGRRRVAGHAT